MDLEGEQSDIHLYSMKFEELGITARDIEISMGYPMGEIPREFALEIADVLGQAPSLCRIQGGYRIVSDVEIHGERGCLSLAGKVFSSGKIITAAMRRSESIAVMVCTAGQGITDRVQDLFSQREPVAGHILDTIGSQAAERAADKVQGNLEREMRSLGKIITNRYSPGYFFWPVSEQHLFFSLLPEKFCGVTLTESAFMVPIKSVSAIVGVGEKVVKRAYECSVCDQQDCIRRQRIA
jgi:hypothetical protein